MKSSKSSGEYAKLLLEDGTEIKGRSFGYASSVSGEVVFNTAMTGYPESLTDPSYKGQILVLTYPLIGNYGAPNEKIENNLLRFHESNKIHITALVVSDYSFQYSHWNAKDSLGEWLRENKIPGIYGVDTRALTKKLREQGTMLGKIIFGNEELPFYDPSQENLVAQVSTEEVQTYGNGTYKIALVDCGVKYNIIRYLLQRDTTVIRVPWNYPVDTLEYDGLFISNGPGDPKLCDTTIQHLHKQLTGDDRPVFGICLGNQLMALASGADTYKLKYGHRSHNQPVVEAGTDKAYITSQNHGYAVDNQSLPSEWKPLYLNINDGTNEGMIHASKPFFSTQFHPEASGGPTDTAFLFDRFLEKIKAYKKG